LLFHNRFFLKVLDKFQNGILIIFAVGCVFLYLQFALDKTVDVRMCFYAICSTQKVRNFTLQVTHNTEHCTVAGNLSKPKTLSG